MQDRKPGEESSTQKPVIDLTVEMWALASLNIEV